MHYVQKGGKMKDREASKFAEIKINSVDPKILSIETEEGAEYRRQLLAYSEMLVNLTIHVEELNLPYSHKYLIGILRKTKITTAQIHRLDAGRFEKKFKVDLTKDMKTLEKFLGRKTTV